MTPGTRFKRRLGIHWRDNIHRYERDWPERLVVYNTEKGWNTCELCGKEHRVWLVPDEVWKAQLPRRLRSARLCVGCFRKPEARRRNMYKFSKGHYRDLKEHWIDNHPEMLAARAAVNEADNSRWPSFDESPETYGKRAHEAEVAYDAAKRERDAVKRRLEKSFDTANKHLLGTKAHE